MQLISACTAILDQLSSTVRQLDELDFNRPSIALSNATIGEHLRHTIEFFWCLEKGFGSGTVNYDSRAHNKLIETDKFAALRAIRHIHDFVNNQNTNQPLQLEIGYDRVTEEHETINSNYFRELTYNIEHAVHHMAIMKIGLREVAPYVEIPSDFGIAASTIRYRQIELNGR